MSAFRLVLCVIVCGTGVSGYAQTAHFAGIETTVASTGLLNPHQIAVDLSGNVYIADVGNNRVLKETFTADGYQESVVASTGLKTPAGVAVDINGNVFVADTGNNRILKEQPSGSTYTETVLPISGLKSPISIAVDSSDNLYISDWSNARVVKETLSGSSYSQSFVLGGPNPDGIAVDASGNVYICAPNYGIVYKMSPVGSGYSVSRIGSGWSSPHGITVNQLGVVYVADSGSSQIVMEVPNETDYTQTVLLPTGSVEPQAIAADANGNLYFNDSTGGRVLKLTRSGANLGSSAIGIATTSYSLIFTFDSSGSIAPPTVVAQGVPNEDFTDAGTGSCTTNGVDHVYQVGEACTIDVSFTPKHSGAQYGAGLLLSASGSVIATGYVMGTGRGPQVIFPPGAQSTALTIGGSANLYGIAIDGGGSIYLVDATNNRVLKETPSGTGYTQSVIISGLNYPEGLALDGAGNVYVSNTFQHTVLKFTPNGNGYSQSVVPMDARSPGALAVDGGGNVYIVDTNGNRVLKETLSNGLYTQSTVGVDLYYPTSVAVDLAGNVYIASVDRAVNSNIGNGWVIKESPSNGSYVQSIVASGFIVTTGVTVDGNGNVYILDNEGGAGYQGEVYRETPSGNTYTQTTLGNNLSTPEVAIADGMGNVYIIDFGRGQVIKENLSDPPALHFASTTQGQTSTDSPRTVTIQNIGNAAMNVPQPAQGYNPSIPSGFVVNDSASSACPLVSESSSVAGMLAAGASCDLTINFSPQLSTDTSGWLTYTYNAPNETSPSYQTTAIPLIVGGAKLTSTITWANPSGIVYGTGLSAQQLNASANVPGTFSYSPAAGSVLTAGLHTLSATFTPADSTDFTTATAQVTINVTQATPTITWPAPSAITYGTALSATELDASTSVAGTFSYSPAAGTVLPAGSQILTVTFTPDDTVDYTIVTASVPLTVNQATPTITWATPANITYGTALSATQLDATSPVAGTFSYSQPIGTVLTAGSHALTVTFVPTDGANYKTVTESVTLNVDQAIPTVTWAEPSPITYGTALGAAQLNATASTPGTFAYSASAGTVLTAGSHIITASFTPTDSANYATATASITLVVNQAKPTVTWPTPASISYGTALGASQLNATASVPGTFSYSPAAGTVLGAGTHTITATFTPTDSQDYTGATATANLVVTQALPKITWPAPASISYGTALSATQLDASSNVAGSFTYSPASGTVLQAGAHTITATFTPTDTANYTAATATTTVTVTKAKPTITWSSPSSITYGTALGSTQLNASSDIAGTFTYTPALGTVLTAGAHTLSAEFNPTDLTDYIPATSTVQITVNQATPMLTWAMPAAIPFGTALSAAQLDATASVSGTFVYDPPAGTILPIGNDTLSVTFTPADSIDYATASAQVILAVVQPVPVVSNLSPAITTAGNAAFTLTVNGGGFTAASVVYWGSTALTTQYVNGMQLTAQIPAADIANAGINAVTVQNPTPGGGTSNILQFEVDSAGGNAPPAFTTATVTIAPGATATYLVTLPSSATNVSATCLNLPAGAACTYSATTKAVSITTSSTTPAGTYQITVVFLETLPETAAALVLAPIFLLPLAFKKRRWTVKQLLLLTALGIAFTAAVTGCGGGDGSSHRTHTVTSSGTVSLTVQ